jgi:oxygen-dependent protoporphyrinogen oxidase
VGAPGTAGHGAAPRFPRPLRPRATLTGSDADLVALARGELRQTLGLDATPTLVRVSRWPRGMPQFLVGHRDRLDRVRTLLQGHPGLHVAGAAYGGVGLPDCIASGEAAAQAFADSGITPRHPHSERENSRIARPVETVPPTLA